MDRTMKNKGGRPPSKPERRILPPPSPTASNGDGHAGPLAPQNGRDAGGRFAAGNKAARGNPFARRVAALRTALLSVATPERVRQLAERLFRMAEGGDVAAAKLVLNYAIGRPAEVVDPDTLDADEISKLLQTPDVRTLLAGAMDRLPAATAVGVAQAVLQVSPGRLVQLLDAAQSAPATPPPMTQERLERLLAEAQQGPAPEYVVNYPGRAGENPDLPTEESHP
jgi:hypothetical protein